MLAADDGNPATMATIHSLKILWDNPADHPNIDAQEYGTIQPDGAVLGPMFQIIERAYEARGGMDPNLPGGADVTAPNGRADIRLQVDEAGELYILSKSDGMIRAIIGTSLERSGDYNRDGRVDAGDYVVWRKTFGETVPIFSGADGNGNGLIDQPDYDFWRTRFGYPVSRGTGSAIDGAIIPEPSSAVLIAAAAMVMAVTRLRQRFERHEFPVADGDRRRSPSRRRAY
jgi:hypothetical protein